MWKKSKNTEKLQKHKIKQWNIQPSELWMLNKAVRANCYLAFIKEWMFPKRETIFFFHYMSGTTHNLKTSSKLK